MRDYRELKVWAKAHGLVLDVYRATAGFPREEMYGLTSQIRRCCVSIPSNIAEGCGRDGEPELARFLVIASGSASELDYQLLLARDLGFLGETSYAKLSNGLSEIRKMLTSFIAKLRPLPANS
jgi:four helix bundle protein